MSKILVIYTAYNAEEYVEESLAPFLNHPDCVVVASSRKFSRFPEARNDNTVSLLNKLFDEYPNFIGLDYSDDPVDREHEAKNVVLEIAATHAKEAPPQYVMIVDSDEFYTREDIDKIIEEIDGHPEIVTFRVPLRNFINDTKHYLEEPFCPPRLFRTSFKTNWTEPKGSFALLNFYWDNDVCYFRIEEGQEKFEVYRFDQFGVKTIKSVWVDHYSWLDNERSKKKIEYQRKHFGHCGFKWENGVKFDEAYYKIIGAEPSAIKEL